MAARHTLIEALTAPWVYSVHVPGAVRPGAEPDAALAEQQADVATEV